MKIASPFISMQFHASPKIPATDYNSFCQAPHKANVTTSPASVNHTVSILSELGHRIAQSTPGISPGHLVKNRCTSIFQTFTLPVRGGFSGHLTVLNFLFITFLSQGTHIKYSPLKCLTSWSNICTFFQLFRPQRLLCSSSWKHYQRATNQIYYFSLIKLSSCNSQINGISLSFYASL